MLLLNACFVDLYGDFKQKSFTSNYLIKIAFLFKILISVCCCVESEEILKRDENNCGLNHTSQSKDTWIIDQKLLHQQNMGTLMQTFCALTSIPGKHYSKSHQSPHLAKAKMKPGKFGVA